jgi:hypothetical protein
MMDFSSKRCCAVFFAYALLFALQAQEPLTLIPRDVYVGETAIMRYAFEVQRNQMQAARGISIAITPEAALIFEQNGITVKEMTLFQNGIQDENQTIAAQYTLEIIFVPWKTGIISLPQFEIPFENESISVGEISIPPFTIASLVEALGETEMRPALPPLLVPGTTYMLAALFVCAPLTVLVLAVLARKFGASAFFSHLKFSRGAKAALKKIKKLNTRAGRMSGSQCAKDISLVVREYLTLRYGTRYTALTCEETARQLCQENETRKEIEEVQNAIHEILARCDFVRFAPREFLLDERKTMIQNAREIILRFESDDEMRSLFLMQC